jgi:hypothetical protein
VVGHAASFFSFFLLNFAGLKKRSAMIHTRAPMPPRFFECATTRVKVGGVRAAVTMVEKKVTGEDARYTRGTMFETGCIL